MTNDVPLDRFRWACRFDVPRQDILFRPSSATIGEVEDEFAATFRNRMADHLRANGRTTFGFAEALREHIPVSLLEISRFRRLHPIQEPAEAGCGRIPKSFHRCSGTGFSKSHQTDIGFSPSHRRKPMRPQYENGMVAPPPLAFARMNRWTEIPSAWCPSIRRPAGESVAVRFWDCQRKVEAVSNPSL